MSVRVWWKFVKKVKFATGLRLTRGWTTRKRSREKHMLESEQFLPGCISRVTSRLKPSREWPTKLTTWTFLKCVFLIFFYQHYISPHYPRNYKELLREKTLAINLRVRNCKLTIIYIISLSFPLHLPLQLQILERF